MMMVDLSSSSSSAGKVRALHALRTIEAALQQYPNPIRQHDPRIIRKGRGS